MTAAPPISSSPPTGPRATVSTHREIRDRLLRLDRVDTLLRQQFAATGRRDPELAAQLSELNRHGLNWLRRVVRVHGWPGRSMIGREAAAAASRLLRHAEGDVEFRHECLTLIARAAAVGEMSPRDVSRLSAALRRTLEGAAVPNAVPRQRRSATGSFTNAAAQRAT